MANYLRTSAIALCAGLGCATAALAEGDVVVYHWFEYIPQELIDKFTEETGIRVVMDTYDSNEAMLASLRAGGMGTYDVAVPGDYMVQIMRDNDMLDAIAEGELSNHGNILPEWLDVRYDPGRQHSIPYQWGSTSFSVNRDVYDGPINTTEIIFNPPAELSGRINMLASQGEVMALAAIHLGIPMCSPERDDVQALNDLLMGSRQHWVSFNSDTAREVLVSGDAAAGMIYDGFSARARIEEGANLEYAFATQGYIAWMDNVVLLNDAPNRDNAIRFMDFLLEPENVGILTNWTQYSAGIAGVDAFLDPALAAQPERNPPEDAGPAIFIEVCDQATQEIHDRIWTALRR
ncbi:extracellular solute-binding protein [Roseinatronobacter alkalisoli]|uniref:Putrescine-binding periplasmic protein n=1 Tax=Roseinatronobacter alkalisoli TaxID=3028235 RepID=A0ABT5TDJ5_9RHOB|nr:extracellular solute-binding protein [Roseinatronobacter sp. HJB301]MDD7973086.1 extracellular solute-binding protein [Roseinatronobacter sp. HJB301]